jgi:hypothetical protein
MCAVTSTALLLLLLLLFVITFTYNYIPETNQVSREYSAAVILFSFHGRDADACKTLSMLRHFSSLSAV